MSVVEYKTITFNGASDDLIEVEGSIEGCDEYNAESGVFTVAGLEVEVAYLANGCWAIRVSQVDEEEPVEARDLALTVHRYSMHLAMDVPSDCKIAAVIR